jgi:hypothetical protein
MESIVVVYGDLFTLRDDHQLSVVPVEGVLARYNRVEVVVTSG